MAIARGYEYDIFVSYAHTDDEAPEGEEGWVTQFVQRLEPALKQRLGGGDGLSLFFDSKDAGPNTQLPELLEAVRKSALFLAIGSPSYAARAWPRDEVATFVSNASDPKRVFVVELLPLNDGQSYPSPLRDYIRLHLWEPLGEKRTPMPFSPQNEPAKLEQHIHELAVDLRKKLELLSISGNGATGASVGAGNRIETSYPAAAKTVVLAQVTEDLEDELDQVRSYLKQFRRDVVVLPDGEYPQGGDAFKAALKNDLAKASLFVQLLGRRIGKMPPDLPEGYTRCQIETANVAGVPIMQWRRPDLDLSAVNDPAYREILSGPNVIASGLESFKRQVLDWVRKPAPSPAPRPSQTTSVFINADRHDLNVAKEIERECKEKSLTTSLPMFGDSSEAIRKDLAANLTESDALFFIYGEATQEWIRSQLRFFNKVKPQREQEPKVVAICTGPPPSKPSIGMTLPNAREIQCPNAWDMQPIREIIAELI